jgi:hypothetical protein
MNILILDDLNYRHETFKRVYSGHNVVSVTKFSQFVEQLANDWDLIHLDHDLGDFTNADTYVDGWGNLREYDGCHAAKSICELDKYPNKVIVHSINASCSPVMVKMLQRVGIDSCWEPFGESELLIT